MTNSDFWDSIQSIISDGFNPEGLSKLEEYADKFINGKLLFKRFSPQEQHGCAEGGSSHVIASILAGAENSTDRVAEEDRISLHNAYFPETKLDVIGFGRDDSSEFKILVSQPFIEGQKISEEEIYTFMHNMGFKLNNPRNWTYFTPEIYLSDMHDENIIRSSSGTIFVIDCDIRLNTPDLRIGGNRIFTTEVICS